MEYLSVPFSEVKLGEYFRYEGDVYRKTSPQNEGTQVSPYAFYNAKNMWTFGYGLFAEDTIVTLARKESK